MKFVILFLLISLIPFTYAQDAEEEDVFVSTGAQMLLSPSTPGPGMLGTLALEKSSADIKGGLGLTGDWKTIGYADVNLRWGLYSSPNKRIRVILGYNAIDFNSDYMAERIEALLKLKLGVEIDKTSLKYGFAPLASVKHHVGDIRLPTMMHTLELKQDIDKILSFSGQLKYGKLNNKKASMALSPGSFFDAKAQLEVQVGKKPQITLLAFYELENIQYSTVDRSISSEPREVITKDQLSTLGLGVRITLGAGSSRE